MRFVALNKVAKIDRTVASEEECETLPYVGLEHIEKDTGHLAAEFEGKPESLRATKFRFTPRHVLYGKLRPYLNKATLPNFDGVCTTEILPILPLEDKLNRTYLWAFLLTPGFVEWASANVSGANLPRISPKLLEKHEIPLPPLPEQERIAAILAKADRLRRLRRYARELSDTYLQSVFLEMFGDPVTNPMGWEISEIGDMNLFISDGNYAEKYPRAHEFVSSGVPFLRANNLKGNTVAWDDMRYITPEKHEYLQKGHIQTNDVLISTRGNIGLVALVPQEFNDANINAQLVLLRIVDGKIAPRYLMWVFNCPGMRKLFDDFQTGTALKQLPVGNLRRIPIPLPPLSLQQEFAHIVRKFERLRTQQREAERQAEHLFQTLLHRAFRGEL